MSYDSKNYTQLTRDISKAVGDFGKGAPGVLKGFQQMSDSAIEDGVLDKKTKELIAMSIAITARCQGCLGFHARTLVKLGTSREEFIEMLGVAVYMGGGPSLMTAAEALMAFDEFSE